MNHQWQQFDHHDTKQHALTNEQEKQLIAALRQSESLEDAIVEAQNSQNVRQGI